MRFLRLWPVVALAFSGIAAAHADTRQDFDLSNKTGYEIKEIYVAPSKSSDWQNDVLGDAALPDGGKAHIKFDRETKTCQWDLKVVYTDDNSSAVWQNIDLCTVEKITIHYDRKSDTTRATFD